MQQERVAIGFHTQDPTPYQHVEGHPEEGVGRGARVLGHQLGLEGARGREVCPNAKLEDEEASKGKPRRGRQERGEEERAAADLRGGVMG